MRYLLLFFVVGCIDPIDPRWQLDHDHVIVARANPPRIRAGEGTDLTALVAHVNGPVTVENPMTAEVSMRTAGPDFSRYLVREASGAWRLEAPDAEMLASARPAMGLPADAPVPVDVMLTFPTGGTRRSTEGYRVKKTVWLGEPSMNPELPGVTIDGAPVAEELVVPVGRDVYVSLAAPAGVRVNWLTNVGTLFQDDVATAYVHVTAEDRHEGQLVVVMRDNEGGVAWRVWSMRAE